VLAGKAGDQAAMERRAGEFFGIQGPWYTVGYRMAVEVETRWGRKALVSTMTDPPCLLAYYNQAAEERNRQAVAPAWPLWSAAVLQAAGAGGCAPALQQ
jgi:hypothetical protein